MSWIDGIRTRLTQLLRPSLSDARTDEEIRFHIEMETERNVAAGMSAREARRQAVLAFGSVQGQREQMRDERMGWLGALRDDSRYAVRHFSRRPLITITMIALLALGMSITTVSFSFMYSYAVAPPAGVTGADDLVRIRGIGTLPDGRISRGFSLEELEEYRKLTGQFAEVAGWASEAVSVEGGSAEGELIVAMATFATENYFPVLGVQPLLGPGLPTETTSDSGSQQAVVIGHSVWERLFGRSPDVLGKTIDVNDVAFTIVGVAAPSFRGINPLEEHVVWLPLEKRRELLPMASTGPVFRAVARLREGVSVAAATSAVETIAARMNPPQESSDSAAARGQSVEGSGTGRLVFRSAASLLTNRTSDVVVLLSENGDPNYSRDLRLIGLGVTLLCVLILLVTGTNVSALLTGLAVARRREIAVRLALGAHRRRVLRQLLTESVLLASIAALTALLIAGTFLRVSIATLPPLPFHVSINWAVAAFAAAAAVAVGLTFGLSPALHATRVGFASALKESTAMIAAPRASLQKRLVVAQIAFTQPLIVALATFLVMASTEMDRGAPTESAEKVISLSFRSPTPAAPGVGGPGGAGADPSTERFSAMRRLTDRVTALPGVSGAVFDLPFMSEFRGYTVHPDDRLPGGTVAPIRMNGDMALPGYLGVVGIPLKEGREFREGDSRMWGPESLNESSAQAAPVGELPIIIGDDLAEALWPGASAIGRTLQAPETSLPVRRQLTVVGVVDESERVPGMARGTYHVYVPADSALVAAAPGTLLIRTAGAAQALMLEIRSTLSASVPGAVVLELQTLADIQREERNTYLLAIGALTAGSVIALFLCAIGLYAVVSFAVGQRLGEIAVRMAVGARARQIAQSFLLTGMKLSLVGMLIGLPLSMLALRYFMYVPEFDMPPVALGPVAGMAVTGIVLVAAAASWIPARRAAGVDPSITLRRE